MSATSAALAGVVSDYLRRAAALALARASAAYAPTSYDDAASVRTRVVARLDAELLIAADQGEDDMVEALLAARTAVVADLTARGASLAPMRTFVLAKALPALTLAQRLYQDPSRETDLLARVAPIHPLFLPPQFRALAS